MIIRPLISPILGGNDSLLIGAIIDNDSKNTVEIPTVDGTAYFVSTTGNDTNSGTTVDAPWATIEKVNSSTFSPGDGVFFKRGETWNENLVVPSSGSADGVIIFGAYGAGNNPILDGTGATYSETYGGFVKAVGKHYVTIQDLTVCNVALGALHNNAGILFNNANYGTVKNCLVDYTDGAGIKFNGGTNATVHNNEVRYSCLNSNEESISFRNIVTGIIDNNYVHHDAKGDIYGGIGIDVKEGCSSIVVERNELTALNPNAIYVDAYTLGVSDVIVRFNYIHDTYGPGIVLGSESGGDLDNVLVHHNIVTGAAKGGMLFHYKNSASGDITNISILNNTFFACGTSGVNYYGGIRIINPEVDDIDFKNNIFANAFNFQIGYDNTKFTSQPAGMIVDTNVIYGVNVQTGGFNPIAGTNTISGDPLLSSSNVPQTGSSAINSGSTSIWSGFTDIFDYNGNLITDATGTVVAAYINCGAL